jgi:N-acetylglucosamine kinase-like BadF-type ATPase
MVSLRNPLGRNLLTRFMGWCLGIDGGGTRTMAWLADDDGKVLGCAESGPSNPLKVGFHAAEREILKAVRACMQNAGISSRAARASKLVLGSVCAGIAGVDRQVVHRPLLAWLRRCIPARRHLLTSDAAIALAAATHDAPGIVVIAGTGSVAFARGDRGKVLRSGGWGIPFDDHGAGYDLGRKAVAAALRAFDGRGPQTVMVKRICQHWELRDITAVTTKQLDQQQIAALFPLVMKAAGEGDAVARRLCDDAARDLASLAIALFKRAGWARCAVPVVLSGGVFQSSNLIRNAFARYLHRAAPRARVELLKQRPVEGALWLARAMSSREP